MRAASGPPRVTVLHRGVKRLRAGHPWIYRSDVKAEADTPAGIVSLADQRGKPLGTALHSPHSEIRIRWLAPPGEAVDAAWWRAMVAGALARRAGVRDTGYRVVHAEGDGLPSLVLDRYGDVAVAQFLSAGIEAVAGEIVSAIRDVLSPRGLLLRNDAPVRERERLERVTRLAFGEVPEQVPYREGQLLLTALPWKGQKTGAFLDQRENHARVGPLGAGGRCLDVFSYTGGFALHLALGGAREVVALDTSVEALDALQAAAAANGLDRVTTVAANAFDWLRAAADAQERFDVIVVDPPAFARDRRSLPRALAGYKELNLRAMKCLNVGGWMFSASCSHHVDRGSFFGMLAEAAQDAGVKMQLVEIRGAASCHPEILTVPETGYLKAALLRRI